ncbi:MAG: 4Fe-4S binding protein [Thermodesulfobacteriota bacterium]
MLWTKGLRSLIAGEEADRLDLFWVFPGLRRFLAHRRHYATLRTAGDLIFAFVVVVGLLGPQDPRENVAVFMAWGLWWPGVVLSWFFVGRMWCGICPFPGLGVYFQRRGLSLNLPIPGWLQRHGAQASVVLLAAIIWSEVVAGLDRSPAGTSLLILAIIGGALVLGVLFPGQAWCRHLCPLGRITGAAATLSITELRANHDRCRGCTTFACKRGAAGQRGCPVYLGTYGIQNNLHCLVCGHCLPLCQRDSPQLRLRNPYTELIRNKGRYITCSYIVPFLIGSQLARFFRSEALYTEAMTVLGLPDAVAFSLLLAAAVACVHGLIRLGSRLFGITEDPAFGRFSPLVPVLLPMAFTGELVYRLGYFASGVGDFLPTLGRQLSLPLAGLAFRIPDFPVQILSAFFMMNGTIAGFYVLWRFSLEDFEGLVRFGNFLSVHLLVGLLLVAYLLVIL